MKLILIVLAITAVTLQSDAASVRKNDIPKNKVPRRVTVEIGGENFMFGLDEYVTWYQAEQICADTGMRLLTLETEARWNMIKDFIFGNEVYDYWWWTAGHKPLDTTTWSWSTTQNPLSFTAWYNLEPSNNDLSDDSCLMMNAGNDFFTDSGWADDRCSDAYTPYICETP